MSQVHTRLLLAAGLSATSLQVAQRSITLGIESAGQRLSVTSVTQGLRGAPGPPGFASTEPNNRTTMGPDGGLFTPDIKIDPLAYYILAKA